MATSSAKSREEGESPIPAQVLYDRSRTSGIELFKHLSTLATAAVGVFFFALSTKVEPPLNADQRLTPRGLNVGLVAAARWQAFEDKTALLRECRTIAARHTINGVPLEKMLKRPTFSYSNLPPDVQTLVPKEIWELAESDIKYEGYALRQAQHNRELARREFQRIPDGLNFAAIPALSSETRQKLAKVRPTTLGQAARVSGVTPADISVLSIWLNRNTLCYKNRIRNS